MTTDLPPEPPSGSFWKELLPIFTVLSIELYILFIYLSEFNIIIKFMFFVLSLLVIAIYYKFYIQKGVFAQTFQKYGNRFIISLVIIFLLCLTYQVCIKYHTCGERTSILPFEITSPKNNTMVNQTITVEGHCATPITEIKIWVNDDAKQTWLAGNTTSNSKGYWKIDQIYIGEAGNWQKGKNYSIYASMDSKNGTNYTSVINVIRK